MMIYDSLLTIKRFVHDISFNDDVFSHIDQRVVTSSLISFVLEQQESKHHNYNRIRMQIHDEVRMNRTSILLSTNFSNLMI